MNKKYQIGLLALTLALPLAAQEKTVVRCSERTKARHFEHIVITETHKDLFGGAGLGYVTLIRNNVRLSFRVKSYYMKAAGYNIMSEEISESFHTYDFTLNVKESPDESLLVGHMRVGRELFPVQCENILN